LTSNIYYTFIFPLSLSFYNTQDGSYYLPDAYVKTGYSSFDPNIPVCYMTSCILCISGQSGQNLIVLKYYLKRYSSGGGSGGGCGGHMNSVGLVFLEQHEGFISTFKNDGTGHISIGYNCDA
jgi:hypothetical protein